MAVHTSLANLEITESYFGKTKHGKDPSEIHCKRLKRSMYTLGFQPPVKQWVDKYNHNCLPNGFNHPNWVNHYFNGGGSLGYTCFSTFFRPFFLVRSMDGISTSICLIFMVNAGEPRKKKNSYFPLYWLFNKYLLNCLL